MIRACALSFLANMKANIKQIAVKVLERKTIIYHDISSYELFCWNSYWDTAI